MPVMTMTMTKDVTMPPMALTISTVESANTWEASSVGEANLGWRGKL